MAISAVHIRNACYGATTLAMGPLRSEIDSYLPKNLKMHNKTYLFSSSLQITCLRNSSTHLCLTKHQKTLCFAELQSMHRVLFKGSSLGTSYYTPHLVEVLFFLDTLKS